MDVIFVAISGINAMSVARVNKSVYICHMEQILYAMLTFEVVTTDKSGHRSSEIMSKRVVCNESLSKPKTIIDASQPILRRLVGDELSSDKIKSLKNKPKSNFIRILEVRDAIVVGYKN